MWILYKSATTSKPRYSHNKIIINSQLNEQTLILIFHDCIVGLIVYTCILFLCLRDLFYYFDVTLVFVVCFCNVLLRKNIFESLSKICIFQTRTSSQQKWIRSWFLYYLIEESVFYTFASFLAHFGNLASRHMAPQSKIPDLVLQGQLSLKGSIQSDKFYHICLFLAEIKKLKWRMAFFAKKSQLFWLFKDDKVVKNMHFSK